MRNKILKSIQFFLVLVFVLGQISPACAFVSGKTSILEICSADGSYKTITVSDAFDPLGKKAPQHEIKSKNCAFCFSHAHNIKISIDALAFDRVVIPQGYRVISSGTIVPKSLKSFQSQPRAPPVYS